jgi:hypothetical protein
LKKIVQRLECDVEELFTVKGNSEDTNPEKVVKENG